VLRGNLLLHHKCSPPGALNNFLLTVFSDRCMLAPVTRPWEPLSGILECFIRPSLQWAEPQLSRS